jgi:hypothetical protein
MIYIFTSDFPSLDLSRDYLLGTVRLPLQIVPHPTLKDSFDCVLFLPINQCWWRWGGRSTTWNGVWQGGRQLDHWEYWVEAPKAEWEI